MKTFGCLLLLLVIVIIGLIVTEADKGNFIPLIGAICLIVYAVYFDHKQNTNRQENKEQQLENESDTKTEESKPPFMTIHAKIYFTAHKNENDEETEEPIKE